MQAPTGFTDIEIKNDEVDMHKMYSYIVKLYNIWDYRLVTNQNARYALIRHSYRSRIF
jgi:hypothetical protein